ncbi:MAG TPA: phage major capsid protein [Rhodothermales bacterium]
MYTARMHSSVLLRKWHGRLEAFLHNALAPVRVPTYGDVSLGIPFAGSNAMLMALGLFVAIVLVAFAVMTGALHLHAPMAGMLALGGITAPVKKSGTEERKPANIRKMEADLKAIAKELEEAQEELAAGPVSQERGEEIEQKAQEMEELQAHIDRYNRIAGVNQKGREVKKVTLPGVDEDGLDRRALYTTPGHFFVMSQALKQYRDNGKHGWSAKVDVGRFGRKMLLRGEEARDFEKKAYDPATLPVLGTDAIVPIDRDPELVRYQEPEILTIRDVLNKTPTQGDTVKYVRHKLTTRAAATVARGGVKPYLKIEFETAQTSVETIAVLSKVTEQDVDDAPRLVSYINGEMELDVRVEEERQIVWGTGTNELQGLFDAATGIPEFNRAVAGDTIIDTIRKMRTDLRKVRVAPNFVAIDPVDWETVELAKGSDTHYLWGLITDLRGPRIWSLRVVESDAMTNAETGERRLLMGDGTRGATIYDRNQVQLAVGFVDDDFARNLRTLRAEERLALAVKRAYAFEFAVTQAALS